MKLFIDFTKGLSMFKKKEYYSRYTTKNNNECIRTDRNCIRLSMVGCVEIKFYQSIEGHFQRVNVIECRDARYSFSICILCVLVEILEYI